MYYVVVNRHKVQANKKNGTNEPVLRISKGKYGKPTYRHEVALGGAYIVQGFNNPLPCGATVWVEADKIT